MLTISECSPLSITMVIRLSNGDDPYIDTNTVGCHYTPSTSVIKWHVSERFLRSMLVILRHDHSAISRFYSRLSKDYASNSGKAIFYQSLLHIRHRSSNLFALTKEWQYHIHTSAALIKFGIFFLRIRFDEPLLEDIDYFWDQRICSIVYRSVQLECRLWILSTLGGGFSAMGDYYSHFAEKAGRISLQQLRLAFDIGDPILIARCKLYIALFLTQKYRFNKAAVIVKEQYRLGKELKDEFLLNCCEGVWTKIKSTRRKRHQLMKDAAENGYIICNK
uniref:Uncharacterized protein n=1 Tax=Ascaris lumbricoides TaxID=6252 RepID=A0A0M3HQJ8_ASCLU